MKKKRRNKMNIEFFDSTIAQEAFHREQMAALSPYELLIKLEMMRKFFLKQYLNPDGTWPMLARTITLKDIDRK